MIAEAINQGVSTNAATGLSVICIIVIVFGILKAVGAFAMLGCSVFEEHEEFAPYDENERRVSDG